MLRPPKPRLGDAPGEAAPPPPRRMPNPLCSPVGVRMMRAIKRSTLLAARCASEVLLVGLVTPFGPLPLENRRRRSLVE